MTNEEKEKTALVPSVGADEEQPKLTTTTSIVTEKCETINAQEKEFWVKQQRFLRENDPSYLKTISMKELYDTVYERKPPLIDGLLYTGTYLFVGAPKVGKSFLMAQLAYHICTGKPLWGYPTRKGTVLYLALEDDYYRLQERLYRMVGAEGAENLFFSITSS